MPTDFRTALGETARERDARQLAYWKRALADLPEQLDLPADRPRTSAGGREAGSVPVRIGAGLHARLLALAEDTDASLFMTLQAGLATTLTRLGAGTDIPVGSVVVGWAFSEAEETSGFFVNTLVLRTDASGNPSFLELLARVRTADLDAYTNQNVPFERLVEELSPARAASRHPLFQVMLSVENMPDASLGFSGLTVGPHASGVGEARFDLVFALREFRADDGSPLGLNGRVEYARDLFDPETAEALAARFLRVLKAAVSDPARPIGEIELLAPEERWRILEEWNDTALDLPPETLHGLFESQAARRPDATAVVFGDGSLSYGELNRRANRLAHLLIEKGVGAEDLVALALPRSFEMAVGLLGILKAGAAYLPLDPDYPAERLSLVVGDARPVCLVTLSHLSDAIPGTQPRVILDDDATTEALARKPAHNPKDSERARPLDARNPAYVIYTLGSTGGPKGVVIAHSGIPSLADAQAHHYKTTPASRVLQFAMLSSDTSVLEVVMALATGGALVLISPEQRGGPALLEAMSLHRVTHAALTPTVLGTLEEGKDLPLETLVVVGEACSPETVARWSRGRLMINGYGPTETTVGATFSDPLSGGSAAPIGRPITNTRVYVLDADARAVPEGVAGELFVAGAGLARGYLGRPDLTAERFSADPHGEPGARMYRTGDLVKWGRDGNLKFLGRVDDKVKNGKADRKALPSPELAPKAWRAPSNAREELLCVLYAELLGVERVGLDDDFFELGGDTGVSIQLVSRARKAGMNISPRDVFQYPTVGALARAAERMGR